MYKNVKLNALNVPLRDTAQLFIRLIIHSLRKF